MIGTLTGAGQPAISKVRVMVITEVLGAGDMVLSSVRRTSEESAGNPLYVTRLAHRQTEALADQARAMLQPMYGELDQKWLPAG